MIKKYILIFLFVFSVLSLPQSQFNINLYDSNLTYDSLKLGTLLPYEKEIIKYEILAKNGFIFEDSIIAKHFNKQIWYNPTTKSFPHLSQKDSINYYLLKNSISPNELTVYENIKNLIPPIDTSKRIYFTFIQETLPLKSIAKSEFKLTKFSYCKTMLVFQPQFLDEIYPDEFERFLDTSNFKLDEYYKFADYNKIRGALFKVYYDKNRILKFEDIGLEYKFNFGKIYGQYYLDSLNRVFLTYSDKCVENPNMRMGLIYEYDNNTLSKEILLVEDEKYFYVQFSSKKIFYEIALAKGKYEK